MKYNVLIVYAYTRYLERTAVYRHLYAFREYSEHNAFYLNIEDMPAPEYLRDAGIDLILFHNTLLATRWNSDRFHRLMERCSVFRDYDAVKGIMPQDEYFRAKQLCRFMKNTGTTKVFTLAKPETAMGIYRDMHLPIEAYHQVLTGYVDPELKDKAHKKDIKRDIDIGYRAWKPEYWLGSHAQLKYQAGEVFRSYSDSLKLDISSRPEDVLKGLSWHEFLKRCRYMPGVEGGASILDYDGSLMKECTKYMERHPEASFAEAEGLLFPGRDGEIEYFALSPRQFECIQAGACQVLIEGDYNGVLEKGKHYIELRKDFSNIDDVVRILHDEEMRKSVALKAYEDVIASDKYTYAALTEAVVNSALGGKKPFGCSKTKKYLEKNRTRDSLYWIKQFFVARSPLLRRILYG